VSLPDFLPILIQIVLAVGIGLGILFASHLFGQKASRSKIKILLTNAVYPQRWKVVPGTR
jgi:NADH:ubiquinone oxidoreductase subunit 3 (subunit A)